MISSEQCRAARILVGMSANDLAKRAEVGIATIKRFESGQTVNLVSQALIERALVAAGIAFIAPGDRSVEGGEGVRLAPIPPEGW